ncbi:hypothetical protein PIB30_018592 [Stylosanthes scabra]|uniref:DUF4283 domain-containing protein n=1 Tax=Stylosanthes scabra TaxID=79078 RepID=A0ABU6S838_9FABA|nr:hypothetical protein [Stylosanthes scabra]
MQSLGDSKIYLQVDKSNFEWLDRTLIGETLNPYNFQQLKKDVMRDWHTIEDVKMMGSMKMLLVFDSKQNMEEALGSSYLLNHFLDIRRWTKGEVNNTRRSWIEVLGLPCHGWAKSNMEKIGEGPTIQAFADVVLEGEACRIFVRDIGDVDVYKDSVGGSCRIVGHQNAILENGEATDHNSERPEESKDDRSDGNLEKGDGGVVAMEEATERSWVDETQALHVEPNKSGAHAKNSNVVEEKGDSWANPARTKTIDDDRRTEDVIREMEISSGPIHGKQNGVYAREVVLGLSPPETNLKGSECTMMSAPPGFEDFVLTQKAKRENKSGVNRGRKKSGQRGRSTRKTTLKLKERITGRQKGAQQKGRKGRKRKDVVRIEDIEGGNQDDLDDEIEDLEEEADHTWRVGSESGIAARSETEASHFLKNKLEEATKNINSGMKKRGRGRKKKPASKGFFHAQDVIKVDRWICLIGNLEELNEDAMFILVYGPNSVPERKIVWDELLGIRGLHRTPVIACGDFNEVLGPDDRSSGRVSNVGVQ